MKKCLILVFGLVLIIQSCIGTFYLSDLRSKVDQPSSTMNNADMIDLNSFDSLQTNLDESKYIKFRTPLVVTDILEQGTYLILQDGTIWEVDTRDKANTININIGDDIIIFEPTETNTYPYRGRTIKTGTAAYRDSISFRAKFLGKK